MTKKYLYTFQAKFVQYKRVTVYADSTQEAMDEAVNTDSDFWEPVDMQQMEHPLYWDHNGIMVQPHHEKGSSHLSA